MMVVIPVADNWWRRAVLRQAQEIYINSFLILFTTYLKLISKVTAVFQNRLNLIKLVNTCLPFLFGSILMNLIY